MPVSNLVKPDNEKLSVLPNCKILKCKFAGTSCKTYDYFYTGEKTPKPGDHALVQSPSGPAVVQVAGVHELSDYGPGAAWRHVLWLYPEGWFRERDLELRKLTGTDK